MKKYVTDTSVLIEKLVSDLITKNEIKGTILIPHAVIAELESQANRGLEIGFLGLEEIQAIRNLKKPGVTMEFIGDRPTDQQIKFAKSGEIDACIRELAKKHEATLITADKVQTESAKAFGIEYFKVNNGEQLNKILPDILRSNSPVLCEVESLTSQQIIPTVTSKQLSNGTFVSASIDDMYPFLEEEEMEKIKQDLR